MQMQMMARMLKRKRSSPHSHRQQIPSQADDLRGLLACAGWLGSKHGCDERTCMMTSMNGRTMYTTVSHTPLTNHTLSSPTRQDKRPDTRGEPTDKRMVLIRPDQQHVREHEHARDQYEGEVGVKYAKFRRGVWMSQRWAVTAVGACRSRSGGRVQQ